MTMKVGVQGRVLLGPAGGRGRSTSRCAWRWCTRVRRRKRSSSKFYRLAVAVPPGQINVPFVHVEQDLTFPLPRGTELDAYVVYVGFDPASLNQKPERKPPAKRAKQKQN